MKTFFRPQTSLSENTRFSQIANNTPWLFPSKIDSNLARAVVTFSHHRDVKVALDDLANADFASDRMVLMARNAERYSWQSELTTCNYFDVEKFGLNQSDREFFWRQFQKGKYLLLISGSKYDIDSASKIMAYRRSHAEVWYLQ